MDISTDYEAKLRERITELRAAKKVSEHRMSLDLGKSASYIRTITNGVALPSVRELLHIIEYFDISPVEFFSGMSGDASLRSTVFERISALNDDDLAKVNLFLDWIKNPD